MGWHHVALLSRVAVEVTVKLRIRRIVTKVALGRKSGRGFPRRQAIRFDSWRTHDRVQFAKIRQGCVDGLTVTQHDPVGLGAGEEFGHRAGPEQ
jgi:hypothetical protein